MGDTFLHFASRNPAPQPTVEFAFTNPAMSQSKKTPTQLPVPSHAQIGLAPSATGVAQREIFRSDTSNAAVTNHTFSKTVKPGPLTNAELSFGTNAFKLRANKHQNIPKPSSNARLRQEVFKTAHTFASPPQNPGELSPSMFVSIPRMPLPANAPPNASNKMISRLQSPVYAGSPAQTSLLKFESPNSTSLLSKPTARGASSRDDSSMGYLDHHASLVPLPMASRSVTPGSTDDRDALDTDLAKPLEPAAEVSQHIDRRPEPLLAPKTPSRHSLDRSIPSSTCKVPIEDDELREMERKCERLESQHDLDSKYVSELTDRVKQLRAEKAQAEETMRTLEFRHMETLKRSSELVKKSQAEIEDLRRQHSHLCNTTIEKLSNDSATLKQEIREAITAATPTLASSEGDLESKHPRVREVYAEYEDLCTQLEGRVLQQQGVVDVLRDELSRISGNYTESLEQKKELHISLIAMADKHNDTAKCLAELHKQHDDLNIEFGDLRIAESAATERVKSLEKAASALTVEIDRFKELLSDNEKAFAQRLKHLEEENDKITHDLQKTVDDLAQAYKEMEALKCAQSEAYAQIDVLRREKEDSARSVAVLERDTELKDQSLDSVRKTNEASALRLAEVERILSLEGKENSKLKGKLVEVEKARSIQAGELKDALQLSRKREDESAKSIYDLSALQEKLKVAASAHDEVDALKLALSETKSSLERLNVEITHTRNQLAQVEQARDTQIVERESLLGVVHASRERETTFQNDFQALRDLVKELQDSSQRANLQLVREQALRRAIEQKLEDSTLACAKRLQDDQKDHQSQMQSLKVECSAQQDELKRLVQESSALASTKATLEGVVSDLRQSIEQETLARREVEQQIATLTSHASDQKTEIRLLEQQVANANARCAEYKTDANIYRSAAEAARASAAIIEDRLKQKELELNTLSSKLQVLELASAARPMVADPTFQARISEQDDIIERLESEKASMKKHAETISERNRAGKLTDPERDLIAEITTGIMRENSRTMNTLRGEIKRKDNEIVSHKSNASNLREELAKEIRKTDKLTAQLAEMNDETPQDDPSAWQDFNNRLGHMSSSPLSGLPAPDHDEPAPDIPTAPSKQAATSAQQQQHAPLVAKQHPQQYRTFAQIEGGAGTGGDDIQDFEEPQLTRTGGSGGRKRPAADIDPADNVEMEQADSKRKIAGKTKKGGKAADANAAKGQPSAKDASTSANTRGKTAKRRKAA